MPNLRVAVEAGATVNREKDSVIKVSFWYIPGGADYTNAEVCEVFFNDMEKAERFTFRYNMIPEMAIMLPLD